MTDDEYLECIETATASVIACFSPKDFPKEPVNWGGMGVLEARKITSRDGEHWQVLIDEVAPDAHEFRQAVEERMSEIGFSDVEVFTEW